MPGWGVSMARVWNRVKLAALWLMAGFNLHSAVVAVLTDLLAQRIKVEYPEGAFVAGLLHDVGWLLIALALPEQYSKIMEMRGSGERTVVDCELEVLGFTHPELSAEALSVWKLPDPIQNAVRDH